MSPFFRCSGVFMHLYHTHTPEDALPHLNVLDSAALRLLILHLITSIHLIMEIYIILKKLNMPLTFPTYKKGGHSCPPLLYVLFIHLMRALVLKAINMADLPVEDSRLDDAWNGNQTVVDVVHVQQATEGAIHDIVAIIRNE